MPNDSALKGTRVALLPDSPDLHLSMRNRWWLELDLCPGATGKLTAFQISFELDYWYHCFETQWKGPQFVIGKGRECKNVLLYGEEWEGMERGYGDFHCFLILLWQLLYNLSSSDVIISFHGVHIVSIRQTHFSVAHRISSRAVEFVFWSGNELSHGI